MAYFCGNVALKRSEMHFLPYIKMHAGKRAEDACRSLGFNTAAPSRCGARERSCKSAAEGAEDQRGGA